MLYACRRTEIAYTPGVESVGVLVVFKIFGKVMGVKLVARILLVPTVLDAAVTRPPTASTVKP